MTTGTQDLNFAKFLFEKLLHGRDYTDLIEFVADHFDPSEVFDHDKLSAWAASNGWEKDN